MKNSLFELTFMAKTISPNILIIKYKFGTFNRFFIYKNVDRIIDVIDKVKYIKSYDHFKENKKLNL